MQNADTNYLEKFDDCSIRAGPSAAPHEPSMKKPEETEKKSQFGAGYVPSFLPWQDHGRTQGSDIPVCSCQRVQATAKSQEEQDSMPENSDLLFIGSIIIVFLLVLLCLYQFFVHRVLR